jgi:hypothetical protein
MMCECCRLFLVYAMALHTWPFLCFGRWVSHCGCIVMPSWETPVGSVLEQRVATTSNHGSWIRMISNSLLFSSMECVCALDQCTFTNLTLIWCKDITCRPPLGGEACGRKVGVCGLAIRDGGDSLGRWSAHSSFEWASQVCSIVVKFGELCLGTVEAVWRAVTFKGRMVSFVGALKGVFSSDVAGASTEPAMFIFERLCAVLSVVVEQEALFALAVRLGDGGQPDGDQCPKHGKATGTVDLLYLFPRGIYNDK